MIEEMNDLIDEPVKNLFTQAIQAPAEEDFTNLLIVDVLNTWEGINAPNLFACRSDIVKNMFALISTKNSDDDQLYVGMVNMCYATRNLSRYGLPYSK